MEREGTMRAEETRKSNQKIMAQQTTFYDIIIRTRKGEALSLRQTSRSRADHTLAAAVNTNLRITDRCDRPIHTFGV